MLDSVYFFPPLPSSLSSALSSSIFLGGQIHGETWFLVQPPPGSLLLSWSTSGLYIRPLINPQWKPSYDILTGQAPVLDRSWFIATESQPTLIYFSFGEEGKHWTEKALLDAETCDACKGPPDFCGPNDKQLRQFAIKIKKPKWWKDFGGRNHLKQQPPLPKKATTNNKRLSGLGSNYLAESANEGSPCLISK